MRAVLRLLPLLLLAALPRWGEAAEHICPEFLAKPGVAEPAHRGEFTFSPYTIHWSNNPEHKHVYLVAVDEQLPGDRLCGVAGGILYGYVGKYQNKVPLNEHGFSPAIIPSLGYKLTEHDSVQVKLLGTAGIMFSYGRQF